MLLKNKQEKILRKKFSPTVPFQRTEGIPLSNAFASEGSSGASHPKIKIRLKKGACNPQYLWDKAIVMLNRRQKTTTKGQTLKKPSITQPQSKKQAES